MFDTQKNRNKRKATREALECHFHSFEYVFTARKMHSLRFFLILLILFFSFASFFFIAVINKGQTETSQYRFLGRNGGFCWVVSQATLVYDKQKPQSVVCVNYVIR